MTDGNDLRSWLKMVEEIGELRLIEGADWDQEIGCLTELNKKGGPALLFDNIKGYHGGYRILTSCLKSVPRIALTLGLPHLRSDRELLETIRARLPQWEAEAASFSPEIVKNGPVLENVHSGPNIDLFEFPVPKWHELDGGRYIGTADAVITSDPDTGEINLGTYRIMVHDGKVTALYISPSKHGRIHYEKYHQMGEACPVAVSVGHHPLIWLVGGRPVVGPEYNLAGAVRRKPIKVIKEEITGLPIPAESEIVFVGWCPPNKTKREGPFGEWTGYYGSKEHPSPIIEVERVYHRHSPIILGSPPSHPPSDSSYCFNIFGSAMIHNDLLKNGVPDVKGVWMHEACGKTLVIVSIKQRFPGHSKLAAILACQSSGPRHLGRYVIVVDDDIDPTNTDDVLWAMCFRSDPEKDIDIVRYASSNELDPMIRKPTTALYNSRGIIDACKPYDWIEDFPKEVKANPQVVSRVKGKWASLLDI